MPVWDIILYSFRSGATILAGACELTQKPVVPAVPLFVIASAILQVPYVKGTKSRGASQPQGPSVKWAKPNAGKAP